MILLRLALTACLLAVAYAATAALAVSNTQSMSFGKFVAGSGGSITVAPSGARTGTGGVILVPSSSGIAADFTVTDSANPSASFIITLPPDNQVTLSSGANTMAVNSFTSNPSGSGVLNGGSQVIKVGATLTVGPSQPVGKYSGNFSITVNYQ